MKRRYLVVANRTLNGRELVKHITAATRAHPCAFRLVVPVSPSDDDEAQAQGRLDTAMATLRDHGVEVEGEVVADEPLTAALAAADTSDEIIVATLPAGISRWLEGDLPAQLERRTTLPVMHIVTPAGMPDRVQTKAVRLSIYCGESDRHDHRPLHSEIVARARANGLAGATVLRGVEGFGASSVIHTTRLLSLSEDLPMVVVLIDIPERIEAFLPELDELVTEGLVVREDVDIIKYAGRVAPGSDR